MTESAIEKQEIKMELSGKCKEDFLKWYENVFSKTEGIHTDGMSLKYMPLSMGYGVYVDFFDSAGIYINDDSTYNRTANKKNNVIESVDFFFEIMNKKGRYISIYCEVSAFMKEFKTRQESRIQAINKANEIYNDL